MDVVDYVDEWWGCWIVDPSFVIVHVLLGGDGPLYLSSSQLSSSASFISFDLMLVYVVVVVVGYLTNLFHLILLFVLYLFYGE